MDTKPLPDFKMEQKQIDWQQLTDHCMAKFGACRENLIQILRYLQTELGYIPHPMQAHIASALSLPITQIKGVIDFYHFLSDHPLGKYRIYVSNNIADIMAGSTDVITYFCRALNVSLGKPSDDGKVYIDETSCIGLGDQGPAALINGRSVPGLNRERMDTIISLIAVNQDISKWPSELFEITNTVKKGDWFFATPFSIGASLKSSLNKSSDENLTFLETSGLRGRGGAGFPTEKKWRFCRNTPAEKRFVVCNADEGEPGTFKDRVLLRRHAHEVIEGMTICAHVIGAEKGFLYLRGEYAFLLPELEHILKERRENKLLGSSILDTKNFHFDIEIHLGAGAYICGEESALIESLEGKRGIPRNRPPFPVSAGYMSYPTVVNNVETFAVVSKLYSETQNKFAKLGTDQSKGTKILSISGDCEKPGIYEFPWGVSITEILTTCDAKNTAFVQVGGPAGEMIAKAQFQRKLCYEDAATGGSFMVFNDRRNPLDVILNFTKFFAYESCGFCTPCRVGTQMNHQLMEKIFQRGAAPHDLEKLHELNTLMDRFSHCGLGKTASHIVKQGLDIYSDKIKCRKDNWSPDFDIDATLDTARTLRKTY